MEAENKEPAEVKENQELEASGDDVAAKTEDAPPDTTDNATEKTNGTDEIGKEANDDEKKDETGEKRSKDDEKEVEIPAKKSKVEEKNEDGQDGAGDEEQGEEGGKQPPPSVKEKATEVNEAEKTTLTAEA